MNSQAIIMKFQEEKIGSQLKRDIELIRIIMCRFHTAGKGEDKHAQMVCADIFNPSPVLNLRF